MMKWVLGEMAGYVYTLFYKDSAFIIILKFYGRAQESTMTISMFDIFRQHRMECSSQGAWTITETHVSSGRLTAHLLGQ